MRTGMLGQEATPLGARAPTVGQGDTVADEALASFARRAAAFGIDTAIALIGLLAASTILGLVLPLTGEDWFWLGFLFAFAFPLTVALFFVFVLPIAFAAAARATDGRTPGKVAAGIAIRDTRAGGTPGADFGQLFRRERSRGWRIVLLVIPAFVDHLSARPPHMETSHDRAAGTIVVRSDPRSRRDFGISTAVFFVAVSGALVAAGGALVLLVLLLVFLFG